MAWGNTFSLMNGNSGLLRRSLNFSPHAFNRPSIAGAVLQTALSLIYSIIQSLINYFPQYFQK